MVPGKVFQFLAELVHAIYSNQNDILSQTTAVHCQNSDDSQPQAASLLDDFIRLCLNTIGKQWSAVIAQPGYSRKSTSGTNQLQLERILKIVELCIITHQMDVCRAFLDLVWNAQGDIANKFDSIYTPLIPGLCKLLQKLKIDTCSTPFVNFFRLLISHYLHYVLGTKSHNPRPPPRKLGCGCADCNMLDKFMAGSGSYHSFSVNQKRRKHLENQIYMAYDLVSFETKQGGIPYSLEVKKLPGALSATSWEYRVQVVQTFFATIGAKSVEKIMGDRYADAQETLKGLCAFQLDDCMARQQNAPDGVSSDSTTSVVRGKRKQPDVINLC